MHYLNLLGVLNVKPDLESFAKTFFRAAEVFEVEERESSNYIDGHYFKGRKYGLTFTISRSDGDYEDLPFWIQIAGDRDDLEAEIDRLIREKVLPAGFRLARMVAFGKKNEQRVDY